MFCNLGSERENTTTCNSSNTVAIQGEKCFHHAMLLFIAKGCLCLYQTLPHNFCSSPAAATLSALATSLPLVYPARLKEPEVTGGGRSLGLDDAPQNYKVR